MQALLTLVAVAVYAADAAASAQGAPRPAHGVQLVHLLLGGTALSGVIAYFFWAWVTDKLPDIVVNGIMLRVDRILAGQTPGGKPVEDADDRELLMGIGMLLVRWAEKKLPDEGMGEQKMRLVLEAIYKWTGRAPLIGAKIVLKLRENEDKLKLFVERVVEKMNAHLKADATPQKPQPPLAEPGASPTPTSDPSLPSSGGRAVGQPWPPVPAPPQDPKP